jgi:hypothetical protein
MVATLVYLLCGFASFVCTYLLVISFRRSGSRLVFWSALCFGCLAINNVLLVADFILFPDMDLVVVRVVPLLVSATVMVYGLIWDTV